MSDTADSAALAPPLAAAAAVPPAKKGNAFTWPFHQPRWFGSLIMLLIGWLPLPLPMILNFGWMFEASAREAEHNPDRLPRWRNLPGMWLHGAVFYVLIFLYFVVPFWIFSAVYVVQMAALQQDAEDFATIFIGNMAAEYANSLLPLVTSYRLVLTPQQSIMDFFFRELTIYSAVLIVVLFFYILAVALFLAGLVRYAATRRLSSFFRPFKNLWLVTAHLPGFFWTWFLMLAMNVVVLWLHIFGVVLWATLGMWMYAHLIGRLAARLRDSKAIV